MRYTDPVRGKTIELDEDDFVQLKNGGYSPKGMEDRLTEVDTDVKRVATLLLHVISKLKEKENNTTEDVLARIASIADEEGMERFRNIVERAEKIISSNCREEENIKSIDEKLTERLKQYL